MQALIHDYFKLVNGYNQYVSHLVAAQIYLWLVFTLFWATRVLVPSKTLSLDAGSKSLEFYAMVGTTGAYVVVLLAFASVVKCQSRKLYELIAAAAAAAAALDDDGRTTKLRWRALLSYYHPRTLYCFSLFGSSELSFLFLLKVSAASRFVIDHFCGTITVVIILTPHPPPSISARDAQLLSWVVSALVIIRSFAAEHSA